MPQPGENWYKMASQLEIGHKIKRKLKYILDKAGSHVYILYAFRNGKYKAYKCTCTYYGSPEGKIAIFTIFEVIFVKYLAYNFCPGVKTINVVAYYNVLVFKFVTLVTR